MNPRGNEWMKGPCKLHCRLLCLFMAVFIMTSQGNKAYAERFRFRWGARLSLSEMYDDNIGLRPVGTESDWITSLTPGVLLRLLTEETEAQLSYNLSLIHYAKSQDRGRVRHSFTLSGFQGIRIAERTTLDLDNAFHISEDPLEISEWVTSVRNTRDRYYRNTFDGRIHYLIGPESSVRAGFGHMWLHNEDAGVEDSQRFSPTAGITYWLTVRYGFRADYYYRRGVFDVSSNYNAHLATAGFVFRINPLTEGNLTYTYDDFNYDDPSRADYNVNTITLGLSRQFSTRLSGSFSFGYFATNLEDFLEEPGDFTGSISLSWTFNRGSMTLDGSTGYRRQFFEAENLGLSYYGRANLTLTYQLLEKLSLSASGSYQRDDFKERIPERQDTNWWARASLHYHILQWLRASANYNFRARDSNNVEQEFTNNRISVTVTAFYDSPAKPL
jgi:hypothetical protein